MNRWFTTADENAAPGGMTGFVGAFSLELPMSNEAASNPSQPEEVLFDSQASGARISDAVLRVTSIASVEAAYGKPAQQGDVTVIPAAEVIGALGFGFGAGGGTNHEAGAVKDFGGGNGGGGGGYTTSRPVAVVVITSSGVEVKPVVDISKIAIAALTTGAAVVASIMGMMKARKK